MGDTKRRASGVSWGAIVRDAVLVAVVFAALGLLVNAVRGDGVPFVADEAWFQERLYQPCPIDGADVTIEGLDATDERAQSPRTLLVDARPASAFEAWHAPDALNVPHDPLTEPSEEEIERIAQSVAKSGMAQVLVYSTGDYPDAEDLARLLATHGIRNVFYVRGGDEALRSALTASMPDSGSGE